MKVWPHIRLRLVSGVILLVPLMVTVIVLRFLFRLMLGMVEPIGKLLAKLMLPLGVTEGALTTVVSLAAVLVLIYIAGFLTTLVLGKRLVALGESVVARIPVVKVIYLSVRKAMDVLSGEGRSQYRSVVMVEFPKEGTLAVAFVTGEIVDPKGVKWMKVFVPTAPNPTSGFLIIAREDQVTPTSISVEEAFKMIVSGGILPVDRLLDGMGNGKSKSSDQ